MESSSNLPNDGDILVTFATDPEICDHEETSLALEGPIHDEKESGCLGLDILHFLARSDDKDSSGIRIEYQILDHMTPRYSSSSCSSGINNYAMKT